MKQIICVAMTFAAGLFHQAGVSAQASGSFRPVHAAHGSPSGLHAPHVRSAGIGHGHARPAFRFAGFGHVPSYRYGPTIVIDNRVVINAPRARTIPTVAELPVVMGIRRQPVADPVIHQVGRSFTAVTLQPHQRAGQRWNRQHDQRAGSGIQSPHAQSGYQGSTGSRIVVVRGF